MTRTYALDSPFNQDPARAPRTDRRQGGHLGVMVRDLRLPVPPGFAITTAPAASSRRRLARRARRRAPRADGRDRGGARAPVRRPGRPAAGQRPFRRPGVDARDDGHDPQPRPQRGDRRRPGARHRRPGVRRRLPRAGSATMFAAIVGVGERARPTHGSSCGRDRGGVPVLEQRPRRRPTAPRGHPRRPRHGGHRAGDGLRQPRRRSGTGVALHPRPRDRRPDAVRRRAVRRPGRGRRRGHPSDGADRRARRATARGGPALREAAPGSSTTCATCATSSSPSSRAACGCCRSGPASAARRRHSGSRSTWPTIRRSR